jgi:hypothetical protein
MTSFAYVMLRDCNRHICFIGTGTSAIEKLNTRNRAAHVRANENDLAKSELLDRKFPHAHLQVQNFARLLSRHLPLL